MTGSDSARVVAATDDLSRQLEDLQDVVGHGPSKDAFRENTLQVAELSQLGDGRWSVMHEHNRRLGFAGTIAAVPLRPGDAPIGALTAHCSDRALVVDPATADFLGAAIGLALVHDPELGLDGDFLDEAWPVRAQIHQATGMIVSQVQVRPEDALALLRGQAFAQDATLADVARQVVERRTWIEQLSNEGERRRLDGGSPPPRWG
jgi:hypothetical protein